MNEHTPVALLCCTLLACGGPSAGSVDAAPGAPDAGDPTVLVGTFLVTLSSASPDHTYVAGAVKDGPTPQPIVWEESAIAGDCRLLVPRVPFCAEGCGGDVCVEDDTCQESPTRHSVGTVEVTGLRTDSGPTTLTIEPINGNYQLSGTALPYPAFDEGDAIRFAASGAAFPPFSVEAVGVAPLALLGETPVLEAGTDLPVAWTPPGVTGISRVGVKLDISHHAGSKGKIECETADGGSLVLPASLVTALLDLGVAGFPTIVVTRRSAGSAAIAPGVELEVSSTVEREVHIPGLVSCAGDDDCPEGQTCQDDLTCA